MVALTQPVPLMVGLIDLTVKVGELCPLTGNRLLLLVHETVAPEGIFCRVKVEFEMQTVEGPERAGGFIHT